MEKWNEAKRKFHDSDYETASGPSFVITSTVKSISIEVHHAYSTVMIIIII